MSYKTITENCYFKTGRDGVVFEALDNLRPNLFDNNKAIDNSILSRSSKFRFTIVDSRKAQGKGRALYYNLDPDEMLLLTYLLADGTIAILKKRLGAYNQLSGQEQVELRGMVESFYSLDHQRFDRLLDFSNGKDATSVTFQKNILNFNSPVKDSLLVKKITFSFEETMKSASKFKVTIEDGEGIKDDSKGNGLNIVKAGTYKMLDKTFLMVTRGELVIPISEGAKRVLLANHSFYGMMKQAEADFTKRKFESEDFDGDNLDTWNPQGKAKFAKPKVAKESKPEPKGEVREEVTKEEAPKKEASTKAPATTEVNGKSCADCNIDIDEKVYAYSTKIHGRGLCLACQKKQKPKTSAQCSDCNAAIDEKVALFSSKKYGKPLCLPCQKKQ